MLCTVYMKKFISSSLTLLGSLPTQCLVVKLTVNSSHWASISQYVASGGAILPKLIYSITLCRSAYATDHTLTYAGRACKISSQKTGADKTSIV